MELLIHCIAIFIGGAIGGFLGVVLYWYFNKDE